jgi:anaerobic selenocysteine-containing dehydrogenase
MSDAIVTVSTICGFCHIGCGTLIEARDGVIHKIRGNPEHPANLGTLCPKGLAGAELVASPDRLKYPLKKTLGGFKRITWDEALDIVADKFSQIKEEHGADTIMWCGGSPITTDAGFGFMQLVAACGSPNFTGPGHLCSQPRRLALNTISGERSHPDYANTRCMLLWGSNPPDTRQLADGVAYGRFDRVIAEAKNRGAKLIVVDPHRTTLAAMADEWLQIKLGTDLALGLAMLNIIIGEKLYDKDFVNGWTVGFDELEKHVKPFTPSWAEKITEIPADKIASVARMYATTQPACFREGNGLDQHTNVVQTVRVIGLLSAVTGNIDIPGGDVFFPGTKFGRYFTTPSRGKRFGEDTYPLFPNVSFPLVIDSLLNETPNRPRAMIVHHANPLIINSNEKRVRKALEQLDFLVVSDIFPTATAQMADIILPDASDLEKLGYKDYASSKGGFMALRRKVVEPVGESRSCFDTEYQLAERMGLGQHFPWKNTEEWVNYRLKQTGITVADLEKQTVIYTSSPIEYRKYLKNGFNTPSKKVEIFSQRLKDHGYDPLPVYCEPVANPSPTKYPLVGTTRKPGNYVHTKFRNLPMLHKIQPDPLVWMYPDDAGARGISDGDETLIESPEGKIKVRAKITKDVQPGVVVIDFGWGNPWDKAPNVNILSSDDARDPLCGATPNRRFFCQVAKA